MTVISEDVASIAGADNNTPFEFAAVSVRTAADGTGVITTRPIHLTASDGVLTTPPLDPGPARVRIGLAAYNIVIPDWTDAEPIALTPLLEAAAPVPPADLASAVINAGAIPRIKDLTTSEYAALSPPDPNTLYIVFPDEE